MHFGGLWTSHEHEEHAIRSATLVGTTLKRAVGNVRESQARTKFCKDRESFPRNAVLLRLLVFHHV